MNSTNRVIAVFVAFFIMGIIRQFVGVAVFPEQYKEQKSLKSMCEEIDAKCPMTVDKNTRVDSCTFINKKHLQFTYTLLNTIFDDIDHEEFELSTKKNLVKSFKTGKQQEFFRRNRITIEFVYADKDGITIANIVLEPEDYAY